MNRNKAESFILMESVQDTGPHFARAKRKQWFAKIHVRTNPRVSHKFRFAPELTTDMNVRAEELS